MFARFGRASTGKSPAEQLDFRDEILLRPAPVGQWFAAGAAYLVSKKLDSPVVNTVVVWFDDALVVLVVEPEQALLLDRAQISGLTSDPPSGDISASMSI